MAATQPAATTEQPTPPARNPYEAICQFAEANRSLLEMTVDRNGHWPLTLSWNTQRKEYVVAFGSR